MRTISICIPTYNRLHLLQQAVTFCIHQTRLPDEIVIGDDSSDAATERWIEAFKESSPVPISYQRNRPSLGQNANINSLFDRAQGTHLMLLHDDDLITPTALEDLIGCWEQHPDLIAAFGKQFILSQRGVVDEDASVRLNQKYGRTSATAGLQREPWRVGLSQQFPNDGYLVLTEAARHVHWKSKQEVGNGGDFDFGLRMGLTYDKFFILDKYTSMYRLGEGGSISSSADDDAALQSYRLVQQMQLPAYMQACQAEKLTRTAPHAIMQALRQGQRREARRMFWSRYHPWSARLTLGGMRRLLLSHTPMPV